MKIIDDLLTMLNYEGPVRDICQGTFQTAVLTRNCGLAATPHDPSPHHDKIPVKEAGILVKKNALTLARMAESPNHLEAAIGMASINSLIKVNEQRCVELNAGGLLAEKGKGKKVALIGHFPFVPRLCRSAKELWVIERYGAEVLNSFTEAFLKAMSNRAKREYIFLTIPNGGSP